MNNENELLDAIAAEPEEKVDLTTIRRKAVELRNAYLEKADLEAQVKEISSKITGIERKDLPDMFSKAKVSSVTVEADGNHPAFVAERNTVYGAKIPEEKRMEAFQWFEHTGHGDLVKSVIEIVFGMQEHEERLRVMKLLSDNGVSYWNNESVHHQTLKAFVKRELQAGRVIPQDLLGVFIFDEVKIK
jgi:MoaA/NifB/PqqE/SkfB family radical SAM enzyme